VRGGHFVRSWQSRGRELTNFLPPHCSALFELLYGGGLLSSGKLKSLCLTSYHVMKVYGE
jgi:hypothetical protein